MYNDSNWRLETVAMIFYFNAKDERAYVIFIGKKFSRSSEFLPYITYLFIYLLINTYLVFILIYTMVQD